MRRFRPPSWLSSRVGLALVFLAVAVVLIGVGQTTLFAPVKSALLEPFVPLLGFFTDRYNGIALTLNPPADLQELRDRNAELEKQVADLTAENLQLHEAEAELKIVAALLDYARANPVRSYVAADVVGRDESLFLRYILLDKGSRDGVARGMPVVTDQGLVGVVTEATVNASKVLLIADPSSAVNVRLQESRAEGVVTGQESGELRLNFISVDVDMKAGERVITSGLGGQFPPGILIGTVASVRKRTFDVFQEADIKSAVNFNSIETVLIITNFEPPDLQPLLGAVTPAP